MPAKEPSPEYPVKLRASYQNPDTVYFLLSEHYAVHGQASERGNPVLTLEGIAVYKGKPNTRVSGKVGPVYTLGPKGSIAVPTGQVFIRFSEKDTLEAHSAQIEQAGYKIHQRLVYAPFSGWLCARSENIAEALKGLKNLEGIAGVENVEPQMLMPSARKGRS